MNDGSELSCASFAQEFNHCGDLIGINSIADALSEVIDEAFCEALPMALKTSIDRLFQEPSQSETKVDCFASTYIAPSR